MHSDPEVYRTTVGDPVPALEATRSLIEPG